MVALETSLFCSLNITFEEDVLMGKKYSPSPWVVKRNDKFPELLLRIRSKRSKEVSHFTLKSTCHPQDQERDANCASDRNRMGFYKFFPILPASWSLTDWYVPERNEWLVVIINKIELNGITLKMPKKCTSIEVCPALISLACHRVSAPRATKVPDIQKIARDEQLFS